MTRLTERTLSLSIGQRQSAPAASLPACRLTLIQALPKGALMDRIVRQATELGVAAIVPVFAARTQGRPEPAAAARRQARWQRIARQAVQQSGAVSPSISPPLELRQYLDQRTPAAVELVFHPGAAPLQKVAASDLPLQPPLEVRCAVGPEGGLLRGRKGAVPGLRLSRRRAAGGRACGWTLPRLQPWQRSASCWQPSTRAARTSSARRDSTGER